jgi:hypothetical protein
VELRRGDAGTWAGSDELLACCFHSTPSDIRELRVRADAGFGYGPVFEMLEAHAAQLRIPMKVVSDSDLIPVTCSEVKAVVFGAKRRWRSYRA